MIDLKAIENQFQAEYERAQDYTRIINSIRIWMESDIENNLPTSEFIFWKVMYPHISEIFPKVADLLREYDIKFSAYSACDKDKDGEPVLFYKLIIHLREENG